MTYEKAKEIVVGKRVYRPLIDETVREEDWKKAEAELYETPESRAHALQVLKELIQGQTDFTARTDDIFLLRFLRVRKFNIEKAFHLLKEFYLFRAKYPDCFPSPSGVEKVLKSNIYNYLPHRDSQGRAIFVIKVGNFNPDKVSFADYVAAGNLVSEYVLDNTVTQINGYVGIWDLKGCSLKHYMTFCSPKNVILLTTLMQDRFPGRFKIAYCVNCPSIITAAWKIFLSVMKEKFKKRVKILPSDMKVLHQYLDPQILPEEYGGVQPPSDGTEIANKVLDSEPYFKYNLKFGYH